MAERDPDEDNGLWIAGFEGDRRVVLSKLGPWQRLFARPGNYVKRPYHRVYELMIEDWAITLDPPAMGPLCNLTAALSIRFQPTLAFAREHMEHIAGLGQHIRLSYVSLVKDAAEAELRELESSGWLDQGLTRLERRIEGLVQELLAIRDIQSRCQCHIEATFADIDPERLDRDIASDNPARNRIALQILKQRRDTLERIAREQQEQQLLEQRLLLEQQHRHRENLERLARDQEEQSLLEQRLALEQQQRSRENLERLTREQQEQDILEQRLMLEQEQRKREILERLSHDQQAQELQQQQRKLDHQRQLLDLMREESLILKAQQEERIQQARDELQVNETCEADKIRAELRVERERIRHEALRNRLETEAAMEEQQRRATSFGEVQAHLQKEIELLAMERQRLSMEEDVHKTKLARARGWIIGNKKRFPLGQDEQNAIPVEAQISRDGDEH